MEQQNNVPPFVLEAIQLAKDTITYCVLPNKLEDRLAVGLKTIEALDSVLNQFEDKEVAAI